MTGRVVVFVKTPGLSPVKTRLAKGLGVKAAEDFFSRSVACVEAVVDGFVAAKPSWEAVWCVVEPEAVVDGRWSHRPEGWRAVAAGAGDLGLRMQRAWDEAIATKGAAILLGGDTPQVSADDLCQAADLAAAGEVVLGPSTDGGFWLVAGRRPLPQAAWRDTPWSSFHTRTCFEQGLGCGAAYLAVRVDVDTVEDLAPCAEALSGEALDVQRALAAWIGEELGHRGSVSSRWSRLR